MMPFPVREMKAEWFEGRNEKRKEEGQKNEGGVEGVICMGCQQPIGGVCVVWTGCADGRTD